MPNEPSRTATGRASTRLAKAGKGHLKGAQQHLNDDVWDGLDSLPYFLTAADIRAVLNIFKTESYRVAGRLWPCACRHDQAIGPNHEGAILSLSPGQARGRTKPLTNGREFGTIRASPNQDKGRAFPIFVAPKRQG